MPISASFADVRGVPLTANGSAAAFALEALTLALAGHRRETPQLLERALELDPDLIGALCVRGFAQRFLGRLDRLPAARDALARAERSARERGACDRERLLIAALRASCNGSSQECLRALHAIVRAHPRDLMAIKLSHAALFIAGDSAGMRRELEACAPRWDRSVPGYGYVLGCLAFARVETGDHAGAERLGRRAIDLEPRDAWGGHAVAHAMEMEDRPAEGLRWIAAHRETWSGCNNFGAHVAWHQALFHLARREHAEALSLYDSRVASEPDGDYRDLANASTLLYRLERAGVAIGDRWEALGERALLRTGDHGSAFAAAHYAIALAGAGRIAEGRKLAAAIETWSREASDVLMREVGLPVVYAAVDQAAGRPAKAARALVALRTEIARLGGSRAQRDIFELIAIDSAIDAGEDALADALLQERLRARPRNAWAIAQWARLDRRAGKAATR